MSNVARDAMTRYYKKAGYIRKDVGNSIRVFDAIDNKRSAILHHGNHVLRNVDRDWLMFFYPEII